jgi:SAM-dependent methyltransferase
MLNKHDNNIFSRNNITWDYTQQGVWVGGRYNLPNLSEGYHGLIMQWVKVYAGRFKNPKVLLVAEGINVKNYIQTQFPTWEIETTDLYWDLQSKPDIIADLCQVDSLPINKYDLIINHSVLEHVYDPFSSMKNMVNSLKTKGFLISATHPPNFGYHQVPRDYFRFVIDWWYDLPNYINNILLQELYQLNQDYIFTTYEKLQ